MEARRIRKLSLRRSGGLEQTADTTAKWLLILGIVLSLFWLLTFSLIGLIACVFGVLLSIGQWTLFRCLGELIRIRKFENGLPFTGQISTVIDEPVYACENCGVTLHSIHYCDGCGAKIVDVKSASAKFPEE